MRVFFGKMNDPEQVNALICKSGDNIRYFGGMQSGDYAFIRLLNENNKVYTHRLWKLINIENIENEFVAKFNEVFQFDDLETKKFIRLNIFKITANLVIFTSRTSKGKGFFSLDLVNENDFLNVIKDKETFNNYIANDNNYRKVKYEDFDINVPNSTQDIYVVKDDNKYVLSTMGDYFYGNDFKQLWNPNRFNTMKEFVKADSSYERKTQFKAYDFIVKKGKTEKIPSIMDLWDLFCSRVSLDAKTKKNQKVEDSDLEDEDEPEDNKQSAEEFEDKNQIYYGIPGCGKSYTVNKLLDKYGYKSQLDNVIRTTFYMDYTYTDFVGQLLPVYDKENKLSYKIVPGPFTKALAKALENEESNVVLIIEELNRGNAPAIFGDIFQLLDRRDGVSEYPIDNEIILQYFKQENINFEENRKIYLPSNLHIIATMNTSDQNVFKLDAAFKRRWKMIRITNAGCKKEIEKANKNFDVPGLTNIKWTDFVDKINNAIIKKGGLEEDRQIGYWFYQQSKDGSTPQDFANKVLEYLWNDVLKYVDKNIIFNNSIENFDDLINKYVNSEDVFNSELGFNN